MEAINLDEIKLDLIDWKSAEKIAEDEIREHTMVLKLNELTRAEAKKQIKSLGGLTSEEERANEKKFREEMKKKTT